MKITLITLVAWLFVMPASAFQIRYGNSVVINTPVFDDLYIGGGTITINAPVHGDLIIAGGTVNINDTVTNDLIVAGGNITFNGFVGDDIRCAGGNLQILKNVTGDVVVTGGTVLIGLTATVGGLLAAGGKVIIDGNVTRNTRTATGSLEINGFTQNIDCRGGKISINGKVEGPAILASNEKIVIGDEASFNGDVRYWVPRKKVDFKQSIKSGRVIYDPKLKMEGGRWYYLGFDSVIGVILYAAMVFLMIVLVQYLFSGLMKKAGETVYASGLRSFLYGLLFWIGLPVAVVLTFITVIGMPVGLILLFSLIILLLLSSVIVSVVMANWWNGRSRSDLSYWGLVLIAFGFFVILKIVSLTPFLGWAIAAILTCVAFGAIVRNINLPWRRNVAVQ
ncbi:MAG TPA: hypothetical protein VGD17_11225 [Chitinophagaceae bacterium]